MSRYAIPMGTIRTVHCIAKCPNCKTLARYPLTLAQSFPGVWQPRRDDANRFGVMCPKACGWTFKLAGRRVVGRKSEHACDAKCWNARGADCECSCVGENHGKAHDPRREEVAT